MTFSPSAHAYQSLSRTMDYNCDACRRRGSGYSYHCAKCSFDVHPGLCEAQKPTLFNDPRHPHTLCITKPKVRSSRPCAACGNFVLYWAFSCEGCSISYHIACVQGDGSGPSLLFTEAEAKTAAEEGTEESSSEGPSE